MRLSGTLDAFPLPEVLGLLAGNRKTGLLVITSGGAAGTIGVAGGAVASSDPTGSGRQLLLRRLVGAGLVSDEQLADLPPVQPVRHLLDSGQLDRDVVRGIASEQVTDAVCELLRWRDGDFDVVFDPDRVDPEGLGLGLDLDGLLTEAAARAAEWPRLTALLPSPATVLALPLRPGPDADREPVTVAPHEWGLLALVDGRRTVAAIVALSGRGEHVAVRALASLVERGILVDATVGDGGAAALVRRLDTVGRLEARAGAPAAPVPGAAVPAPRAETAPGVLDPAGPVDPVILDLGSSPDPAPAAESPAFAEAPVLGEHDAPEEQAALADVSGGVGDEPVAVAAAPGFPRPGPASIPVPMLAPGQGLPTGAPAPLGAEAVTSPAVSGPGAELGAEARVNRALVLRLIAGVQEL